jgi:hypothetical protein
MNSHQTPPGGRKPAAKSVDVRPPAKPAGGKPRDEQDKAKPGRIVAEATGTPKREEAMLAAARHARAIGEDKQRPRHMMSAAFESIERSFNAAKFGAVEVNRKLIDIARGHVISGFDFAKDLAGAKTPLEAARMQMAYFDERMKALAAEAAELRALQAELLKTVSAPLREHVMRG